MGNFREGLTPLSDIIGEKLTSDKHPRTTVVFNIADLPDTYPVTAIGVHVPRIHSLLVAAGVGEAIFEPGDHMGLPTVGVLSPEDHGIDSNFVPLRHSSSWARTRIPITQFEGDHLLSTNVMARSFDFNIRYGIWRAGVEHLASDYSYNDLKYAAITSISASTFALFVDLATNNALTALVALLPPFLISRIQYNEMSKKELADHDRSDEGIRKTLLPGNEISTLLKLNLRRRFNRVAAQLPVKGPTESIHS